MNPERFYRVSKTQLSIARYYGGITYNGDYYYYLPFLDELVRSDVFDANEKARVDWEKAEKAKYEKLKEAEDARQERLF